MENLQRVYEISLEMLKNSKRGSWDDVLTLQNERDLLLQQIDFQSNQLDDLNSKKIEEIIKMNDEISNIARQEQADILSSHGSVKNSKNAIDAYNSL